MRRRQLRIFRYNDHTFGIDDRSRKYHSIFKIIHGYCTQDKPSLDLCSLYLHETIAPINISTFMKKNLLAGNKT